MAQAKHQIQSLLQSIDAHPRHRFGQNFMIAQNLLRLVADTGGTMPEETPFDWVPARSWL